MMLQDFELILYTFGTTVFGLLWVVTMKTAFYRMSVLCALWLLATAVHRQNDGDDA